MKPTSPDERDPQDINPELSECYRAGSRELPSARIEALIAAAAQREVAPVPRRGTNWRIPASIAAVLVIGVSLGLLVQENEPPHPSLDHFSEQGRVARPQAASPALNAQPKAKGDARREDRPTRERTARPERHAGGSDQTAPIAIGELAKSAVPATEAPAPSSAIADSDRAASAPAARREFATKSSADMKDEVQRSSRPNEPTTETLREQKAEVLPQPQDWLRRVDDLLRAGNEDEARRQLIGLRQQYPHYPLPERFLALLAPDLRGQ